MVDRIKGTPRPRPLQRVEVNKDMGGETIYENPAAVKDPTAAQKQFVATPYTNVAKYRMDRTATQADVTVRIQFVKQARGEEPFKKDDKGKVLKNDKGEPIPDPDYKRNIGPITAITDPEEIKFAQERCDGIGPAWDHYSLKSVDRPLPPPAGAGAGAAAPPIPAPPPTDVKLPLKFKAEAVFDTGAKDVHKTIRLFGHGTEANREGAHPIDAGHWYMDTKVNYAGMNEDTIAAHEYGHLLGLHDEYSRSNDQVHQMMHVMGGGAKNQDKLLDRETARKMTAVALFAPISGQLNAKLKEVTETIAGASKLFERQLATTLRTTFRQSDVRSMLVSQIEPHLSRPGLKRALPEVVRFESSDNFSNITLAKLVPEVVAKDVADAIGARVSNWKAQQGYIMGLTGADGTTTDLYADYSANVTGAAAAGAGKTAGDAVANQVVGGVPKVPPPTSLLGELNNLPNVWKNPKNRKIDAVSANQLKARISGAIATAEAMKLLSSITTVKQLYQRVLTLVETTAVSGGSQILTSTMIKAATGTVDAQLAALDAKIANEVDALMGLGAGGVAAVSADPNIKALASTMVGLLKAQQNPKSWDQSTTINPGSGGAGQDVKYSADSMMGYNNTKKEGFRADMINPVVDQFNSHLKKATEDKFTAETR